MNGWGEADGTAAAGEVFHLELRRFPHSTHAFNLAESQLHDVLLAWVAGRAVEVGEHRWAPDQATLTIIQGPVLPADLLALGRGWSAARRSGRDVTERLLASSRELAAQTPAGTRAAVVGDELADELLRSYGAGPRPVRDAWRIAGEHRPEWYAGERLIAAEHALRRLLSDGLVVLEWQGAGAVSAGEVDGILRDWRTWSADAEREVVVVASDSGRQGSG